MLGAATRKARARGRRLLCRQPRASHGGNRDPSRRPFWHSGSRISASILPCAGFTHHRLSIVAPQFSRAGYCPEVVCCIPDPNCGLERKRLSTGNAPPGLAPSRAFSRLGTGHEARAVEMQPDRHRPQPFLPLVCSRKLWKLWKLLLVWLPVQSNPARYALPEITDQKSKKKNGPVKTRADDG
ncbi:hypothetical protein BS50DRAFT_370876 [Corynespora cassiicola Philippines]|uniref:Uncharacterized protein n=1 Tax=Corynespora cassiicola Philippines TaxID=1448308 RepID=A0A2T2NN11_CORCC|nr:hypothetical protein BS50DRAFT_370876 [Corynespora cassiicola Philippines]